MIRRRIHRPDQELNLSSGIEGGKARGMSKKTLPSRVQYLSPEQIKEAVDEVASLAAEQQISIALVGGYALQLYGSRRLTADVDFCADAVVRGLKSGPRLSFGGQQVTASNGVIVDMIVRDDSYAQLYEDALLRSRPMRGVGAHVVLLEHLLAMKMQARRSKDYFDLDYILEQDFLNVSKARKIVYKFLGGAYAAEEFDSLVMEAEYLHPKLKKNRSKR